MDMRRSAQRVYTPYAHYQLAKGLAMTSSTRQWFVSDITIAAPGFAAVARKPFEADPDTVATFGFIHPCDPPAVTSKRVPKPRNRAQTPTVVETPKVDDSDLVAELGEPDGMGENSVDSATPTPVD